MSLEKTIEELSDSLDESIPTLRERRRNAIKLGIEALKLYDHNRTIGQHVDPVSLPGETDD